MANVWREEFRRARQVAENLLIKQQPSRLSELREAVEFIKRYTAGVEVEWRGVKVQSEWSRRQLPVYIACGGPKALNVEQR